MIGLDTTAFIDLCKYDEKFMEVWKSMDAVAVTTDLNYAELMFGLSPYCKGHAEEEALIDSLFENVVVLKLDTTSIKSASKLYWDLKKKGKEISFTDSLIAGILKTNGINKLVTRNKKHFDPIPGLEVVSH